MPWHTVEPVCDYVVIRGLCGKPYPNHPRGCPNIGKKTRCPPKAPLLHEVIALEHPVWAVWNAYPLGEHMDEMKRRHPQWTERQLRNPLYWQGRARKHLREEIRKFCRLDGTPPKVVGCPEACGCNLTATMKQAGIPLLWPPQRVAYQIVLVGWPVHKAIPDAR